MIAWIYSDPVPYGFDRAVTTSYQKFSEATKTIVGTSNHFRDVANVVCDDFMDFGDSLGAKQVPARLVAPRGAPLAPRNASSSLVPDLPIPKRKS